MRRVGSRDLVRVGTVLFCLAFVGPAVASSYAWFCASLAVLGGLGGLLDVAFNVQGIAVQRAYGRPILAGLHGVWSVALFAGGAVGALAAAVGVSPAWQFAVVAAVLALVERAAARVAAAAGGRAAGSERGVAPAVDARARSGRDRLCRLRRRGSGGGLERDLCARQPRSGRGSRGRRGRGVRRRDGRRPFHRRPGDVALRPGPARRRGRRRRGDRLRARGRGAAPGSGLLPASRSSASAWVRSSRSRSAPRARRARSAAW